MVLAIIGKLYIFWFLHQTTTFRSMSCWCMKLYIFWFLHQTTTRSLENNGRRMLYIFWFLHQTTTWVTGINFDASCISFDSYIKPQHMIHKHLFSYVVYLLIPTSNHNLHQIAVRHCYVVYLLIPTSNHNVIWQQILILLLYIFWFLHQTTTGSGTKPQFP